MRAKWPRKSLNALTRTRSGAFLGTEMVGRFSDKDMRRVFKQPRMRTADLRFKVRKIEDGEKRLIEFIGSTGEVDRFNTVILQNEWILENYLKNSVFLWAHSWGDPPIGRANKVWVDGKGLKATLNFLIEFPRKGLFPFADLIYDLYTEGFLHAVSVGWQPGTTRLVDDADEIKKFGVDPKKHKQIEVLGQNELLELSAVPIPGNADALKNKLGEMPAMRSFVADDAFRSMNTYFLLEGARMKLTKTKRKGRKHQVRGTRQEEDEEDEEEDEEEEGARGGSLAALFNRIIDEMAKSEDDEDSDKPTRAEIISQIASAGGIEEGTVNQILNASIDCPPLERLRGFMEVLDIKLSTIVTEGNKDGCEYGDPGSPDEPGPEEDEEESSRTEHGNVEEMIDLVNRIMEAEDERHTAFVSAHEQLLDELQSLASGEDEEEPVPDEEEPPAEEPPTEGGRSRRSRRRGGKSAKPRNGSGLSREAEAALERMKKKYGRK